MNDREKELTLVILQAAPVKLLEEWEREVTLRREPCLEKYILMKPDKIMKYKLQMSKIPFALNVLQMLFKRISFIFTASYRNYVYNLYI